MAPAPVSRPSESRVVAEFLARASCQPAALLVEGEPGIGKTTLWLSAVRQARESGFAVLSSRTAPAESVFAYAALSDLLGRLGGSARDGLPNPQRLAVDRVLLRADAQGAASDPQVVSAAFLSIVEALADASPLLIAIDDLQWIDQSSAIVVAYAARRLSGRVGLIGTIRTGEDTIDAGWWLQVERPEAMARIRLSPLTIGALRSVISERLGRSFPRPAMARIHALSGGNPFYAIELARTIDIGATGADIQMPLTLAELVRARIGGIDARVGDALLAVACLATPTVELVAQAVGLAADEVVELVEDAEGSGIVTIDGQWLRFTHPLLGRGVYEDAGPARRRNMHRRLAGIVEQPEIRARHLALGATRPDAETLRCLDQAADIARLRGAPAAAAELLEMGIKLGGDTPERQIRLAWHHHDAGDPGRARAVLEKAIAESAPGKVRAEALMLTAIVRLNDDSFSEAAGLLEKALADTDGDVSLRVRMLTALAFALVNAGQPDAAVQAAEEAVANAEMLPPGELLGLALGMAVVLRFMRGDGVDEASMQRALALENPDANVPLPFRPRVQNALLLIWTGQLETGHTEMLSIRRRCLERGEEAALIFVGFHTVLLEIWRGDFAEAALIADDTMERALQLGGDLPRFVAHTVRGAVGAYTGRAHEARADLQEALDAGTRSSSFRLSEWSLAALGFLEVSLGEYEAAVATLQPLLDMFDANARAMEIISAFFVPEAVEALVSLGRIAEAQPLADVLERSGRQLDRPWMIAVGARCRAMLLAGQGDIDGATVAAQSAMAEHARVPMPFERARTELLVGQLQRRQRQKDAASATLQKALQTFESLNTPLWAERVRGELARARVQPGREAQLTPSEQRVAELAASGMTNRDVAAALFISPKTVETNLSRIYRKLKIHSRAELGHRMGQPQAQANH